MLQSRRLGTVVAILSGLYLIVVAGSAIPRRSNLPDGVPFRPFAHLERVDLRRGALPIALPLLALFGIAVCRFPAARGFFAAGFGLGGDDAPPSREWGRGRRAWFWLGAGALVAALGFLEVRQPYYFTQDDSFGQFLPVILLGCRSLFDHGVLASANPYQLLGGPAASLGTYSLTYPPTYVAYAIARFLCRDEHATIDVFAHLHLAAGYVACYAAARRYGCRAELAVAVGLCTVLSGWALIDGRSWCYMLPVILWLPLLAWFVPQFGRESPRVGGVFGLGVVVGAWFHAGNAQMWLYGCGFFAFALLLRLAFGETTRRNALLAGCGLLIGAGLAFPLTLCQYLETCEVPRGYDASGELLANLAAAIVPTPFFQGAYPDGVGTHDLDTLGEWYSFGTVFPLVLLAAAAVAVTHRGMPARRNVPLLLALLAFILALGTDGVLWSVLHALPVLDKFTKPFKFWIFFVFFGSLGAGVFLSRGIERIRRPGLAGAALTACVFVMLGYHVLRSRAARYAYGDLPYPELPAGLVAALSEGERPQRVLAFTPVRSTAPGYSRGLQNNLPSAYGIHALQGFDDLLATYQPIYRRVETGLEAQPVQTCRDYGVGWLLVDDLFHHPVFCDNPNLHHLEQASPAQQRLLHRLRAHAVATLRGEGFVLYRLTDPAPLAFPADSPQTSLPLQVVGADVIVDLTSLPEGGEVILNYLARPFWNAKTDGVSRPVYPDAHFRCRVGVPAGTRELRFQYEPPWLPGGVLGTVLVMLGMAASVHLLRGRDEVGEPLPGFWIGEARSPCCRP